MDSDSDNHDGRKRPQVVRPHRAHPRPLFSDGSLNNSTTQGASASTSDSISPHSHSRMPSTSSQLTGDSSPSSDSRGVFLAGAILTESPVSSPTLLYGQKPFSSTSLPSRGAFTRSRPVKKTSLLSSGSTSDPIAADELSSQSRRRWDDLRRHFLPAHPSANAAHAQPPIAPPPTSDVPQRPSTPKQFRIPKLGFRQVVEQVHGQVVDESKRFADDILSASRAVRSTEPKPPRREREGTLATMATSFNMSFMSSNSSLGMSSTSTSNNLSQGRTRALRRPPSLQSVASHTSLAAPTSLYTTISYYASIATNQSHVAKSLPHESEVLFALLVPFSAPRGETADSERLQAIETFEITARTWRAASYEVKPVYICSLILSLITCLDHRLFSNAAFGAAKLYG